MKILNAGCGRTAEKEKENGISNDTIYLDIRPDVGADIVHNMNSYPYPFNDNTFDEIILSHSIEHLDNAYDLFEELHRIAKPNCLVRIITPHYTDWTYWRDPGHKLHFNSFSFDRFEVSHGHHFDTEKIFKITKINVRLQRLWRYLGFNLIINLPIKKNPFRKFWESYLCFIIRGVTINVELRVMKEFVQ